MVTERLPLTEAARRLNWRYWRCRDALLAGELRGGRDPDGRYWVETTSVDQHLAHQRDPKPIASDRSRGQAR